MPVQRLSTMKTLQFILGLFAIILITTGMLGCTSTPHQGTPTEDRRYLTPIPQATLDAYAENGLITTKLQAVIAARRLLSTTRLSFPEPPKAVIAEALTLDEVRERITDPSATIQDDRPGDTEVWLVVFEGETQVIPPDASSTVSPSLPAMGCIYVVLDENQSGSVSKVDGACPDVQ